MFYLGIDIGKNTHVASLIDDKKKVIFKAFSFSNSIDGAESLIFKLEPYIKYYLPGHSQSNLRFLKKNNKHIT